MSATSSLWRRTAAGYTPALGLPSVSGASLSSGLVTVRIVVLATRVYRAVVSILPCPSSAVANCSSTCNLHPALRLAPVLVVTGAPDNLGGPSQTPSWKSR